MCLENVLLSPEPQNKFRFSSSSFCQHCGHFKCVRYRFAIYCSHCNSSITNRNREIYLPNTLKHSPFSEQSLCTKQTKTSSPIFSRGLIFTEKTEQSQCIRVYWLTIDAQIRYAETEREKIGRDSERAKTRKMLTASIIRNSFVLFTLIEMTFDKSRKTNQNCTRRGTRMKSNNEQSHFYFIFVFFFRFRWQSNGKRGVAKAINNFQAIFNTFHLFVYIYCSW